MRVLRQDSQEEGLDFFGTFLAGVIKGFDLRSYTTFPTCGSGAISTPGRLQGPPTKTHPTQHSMSLSRGQGKAHAWPSYVVTPGGALPLRGHVSSRLTSGHARKTEHKPFSISQSASYDTPGRARRAETGQPHLQREGDRKERERGGNREREIHIYAYTAITYSHKHAT